MTEAQIKLLVKQSVEKHAKEMKDQEEAAENERREWEEYLKQLKQDDDDGVDYQNRDMTAEQAHEKGDEYLFEFKDELRIKEESAKVMDKLNEVWLSKSWHCASKNTYGEMIVSEEVGTVLQS